jgi:hypothetical protein
VAVVLRGEGALGPELNSLNVCVYTYVCVCARARACFMHARAHTQLYIEGVGEVAAVLGGEGTPGPTV